MRIYADGIFGKDRAIKAIVPTMNSASAASLALDFGGKIGPSQDGIGAALKDADAARPSDVSRFDLGQRRLLVRAAMLQLPGDGNQR